ncbi:hypothetical protein BJ165DRAFT_1404057 [Panaeolus papilionaceus]|nr:hypothetical protein BJ165DRAFT_1404057 [Panaeolus papilionaceus]
MNLDFKLRNTVLLMKNDNLSYGCQWTQEIPTDDLRFHVLMFPIVPSHGRAKRCEAEIEEPKLNLKSAGPSQDHTSNSQRVCIGSALSKDMSGPARPIPSGFPSVEPQLSPGTAAPQGAESYGTSTLSWTAWPFTLLNIIWTLLVRIFSRNSLTMHGSPLGHCANCHNDTDTQVLAGLMDKPLLGPGEQPVSFHPSAISPSLVFSASTSRHLELLMPEQSWHVLSSWDICNPTRIAIPRAFTDTRREEPDLLHIEAYKLSMERKHVALSEQILVTQKHFNRCQSDEGILLLGVQKLAPMSSGLTSSIALTIARAARRSLEAKIKLCEARLAQAQLQVQREIDCLEEAQVALTEAEHQVFPIISAFLEKGWNLADLPIYIASGPGAVFPSPPALSQIKSHIADTHPYLPARTISRHAFSSLEQSSQSGSDEPASDSS